MVEWYRPLRRLMENAPRGALRDGRVASEWLEGQRAAGRVSADDLRFAGPGDVDPTSLTDPQIYENMFGRAPLSLTGTASRSPFRMHGNEFGVDQPHYSHHRLHSPDGDAYREILLRSPEMPGHPGLHFNRDIYGGRRVPWYRGSENMRPDDVIGWLRMQDRMPAGQSPNGPWSWIDESQSDRFGELRDRQRELVRRGGPDMAPHRADRVTQAEERLGPWRDTWQDLLFRRAMWDAADRNGGRLAWTSGMEQGLRYPYPSGLPSFDDISRAYGPQYDSYTTRLARREARRLGMGPESVGTGYESRPVWEVRDTRDPERGGQRSWFLRSEDMADDFARNLGNDEAYAQAMRNVREAADWQPPAPHEISMGDLGNVRVPYHYFQFDPAALERHGLPYFRRGGRV